MKRSSRLLISWRVLPLALFTLLAVSVNASAGSWHGIEPLKTRRADVLKILGTPVKEAADGPLTFPVMGGTVTVFFVDQNLVRAKRLRADVVGTVLQIVLQHENSSDTPDTLDLPKNNNYTREDAKGAVIFRDLKEGIVYTFMNGKLKTTRYTFSENQISRARH
jgi:hypothetical protein